MKAIVNTAPGRLEWKDWPTPEPGPGQVRIRTFACGICATDLEMIAGWDRTACPSIPGHEWSGVVDALGAGADRTLAGRPCVAENVLADGGEVGFEHPGGYGQYLTTAAANVHPLPDGFPLDTAVLIEPLAVCARAWKRLDPRGRRALIVGDGPIGLLMLLMMRRAGVAEVALVGGRPLRLALARALGAARVFNYHEAGDDLAKAIAGACGTAFGTVVEASGSGAAFAAALTLVAAGGKVLLVGDYGEDRATFRLDDLQRREWELIGTNASAGGWAEAVRLATAGGLPLQRLITHRFPVAEFAPAVDLARTSRETLKVVLLWSNADAAREGRRGDDRPN